MKILFLTERFPPDIGGVAASANRIAHSLAYLGHSVHVVSLTRELASGVAEQQPVSTGVFHHRFGQSKNIDFTLQQLELYLDWLHEHRGFQLIWGHYAQLMGFLSTFTGLRWMIPTFLALRGNDIERQIYPPGDFARLQWCLQRSSHLLTVSSHLANRVKLLVDRTPFVLPNAVDTDFYCPGDKIPALQQMLGINPSFLVLGFLGELRAKKGLQFLLPALADIRSRQAVQLLVIGDVRANDRGEFERMCSQHGIESHIVITGNLSQTDVLNYLRLVDLFLLPSLWEGMPNSLLEAMSCGISCIASDAGGIPEIIHDNINGMLIPRTKLHRLSDRIQDWIALSTAQKHALSIACRQTATHQFSLTVERRHLETLLAPVERTAS